MSKGPQAGSASFYDQQVAGLDRRWRGALGKYFMDVERRHILAGADYAGKRVLDIGTGSGLFLGLVAEQSRNCLGVDLAIEPMLAGRAMLNGRFANVAFAKMDATRLGTADNSFDIVTAIGALEQISDLRPIFLDIRRVLAPDGRFIFTVWNADKWMSWRFFDRKLKGSVEHRLVDLTRLLSKCGMELDHALSTLFIPRRIFWAIYYGLAIESLRSAYLYAAAKLDNYLLTYECSRHKGYELIIVARGRP